MFSKKDAVNGRARIKSFSLHQCAHIFLQALKMCVSNGPAGQDSLFMLEEKKNLCQIMTQANAQPCTHKTHTVQKLVHIKRMTLW